MAYTVHTTLATRAVAKLYAFPEDIQRAFLATLRDIEKTLRKNIQRDGAPSGGAVVLNTAALDLQKRAYRTRFPYKGKQYYVTFQWPWKTPPKPLPRDYEFTLLIASLGDWEEKFFREIDRLLKRLSR